MEPTTISVITFVTKIEEKFQHSNWAKTAGGTTYISTSLGWFVQFEGSSESINVGDKPPPWSVGDKIKITFNRIPHTQ